MTTLQIDILLLFIITFAATLLGYIILLEYKRAKHLDYVKKSIALEDDEFAQMLKEEDKSKRALSDKINSIMIRAGFNFPLYLFIIIFTAFILLSGSLFTLFLQHWSGFLLGVPFGAFIFSMILSAIIQKRKKEFNKALATSISVLVKMMKNGIGFEQALQKSITVSSSILFKNIFDQFFSEKNTLGEEEAFKNINKYVQSKELRIFALAIKIGRSSGGQFSNTLEKVEHTIGYREKMQQKIDVVTREGSVGSYVVVFITIFLYFSLNGNFDGKLHTYFMESPYGRFQLLGISIWVFIGMIANKLITRVNK